MTVQWADVGSVEGSFAYDDTDTYSDSTTVIAFRGISGLVQQLYVGNRTTYITKDGSNNLSFTDTVLGTRTLTQLAGAVWGTITGTLSNQTDLNSALAGKQPLSTQLTNIAALAVTDGNIIVGNGTTWVAESGATARTSLGLGTSNDVSFAQITANTGFVVASGYGITSAGTLTFTSTGNHYLHSSAAGPSVPTLAFYGKNAANANKQVAAQFLGWTASTNGAEVGYITWSLMGAVTPGTAAYNRMVLSNTGLAILGTLTVGSAPTVLTNATGTIKESALEAGELSAIAGLTSAADSLPYFTGSNTAALTTLTSFARTLLDDADAATARTTLGISSVVLYTSTTNVTNDNALEKTTATYTIPAGKLANNGESIEFSCYFFSGAAGSTKQFRVYFGATKVYESNAVDTTLYIIFVQGKVVRSGATSQLAFTLISQADALSYTPKYFTVNAPAETLSGTVEIKATVQNSDLNPGRCGSRFFQVLWRAAS